MSSRSTSLLERPHDRARRRSITQRLAHGSALRPWRVVAGWSVLVAASVVIIGTLLGSAFSSDGSLTNHPESARAHDTLASSFPQGDRVDEAVVIRSEAFTADDPEFQDFVAGVRASLEDTGAIASVGDPYTDDGSGGISEDRHAIVVAVTLGDDPQHGIRDVLDQVSASDAQPGFAVAIAGSYTLDHDFNELSNSDLKKGELQFGLPAALIVLLLVFGAVVAASLPLSISLVSIIVSVAVSAVVGQFTSLSFFIVNMITAMGLALGIDYSLFVLSRYREERTAGRDKLAAIVATGGTSSKAVLFSGTSFVVALFGLLLVPDNILRSLALGAIIVGLVTMAAALTLLPALLSLLGDRVNALRLPVVGRDKPAESAFWTRAVRGVVRHPGGALAAGILVLLTLSAPRPRPPHGKLGSELLARDVLRQGRRHGS